MPSHATAQHNSEIRRRQLAGEDITAGDHSTNHAIPPIDNPASPAEFPVTAQEYAPQTNRFEPRTPAEAQRYADESNARHGGAPDAEGETDYADEEEEEVVDDGE